MLSFNLTIRLFTLYFFVSVCSLAPSPQSSPLFVKLFTNHHACTRVSSIQMTLDRPTWLDRSDREEIVYNEPVVYSDSHDVPLFDTVHKQKEFGSFHSLSTYSLKDISDSYKLSLSYLGDFIIQMGIQPPIDESLPLGDYLTGDQIYTIMEAATSLDPLESNIDYDSTDLEALAEEYSLSTEELMNICAKENFNLPFGKDTTLHISEMKRLQNILDTYQNIDGEVIN